MRLRSFSSIIIAFVLAACSTVTVYDPLSPKKDGNVPSLDLVLGDGGPVVIVFVHGVGDHCPGYALGGNDVAEKDAWLSPDTMNALHLKKQDAFQPVDWQIFRTDIGMGGKSSEEAVHVRERKYWLQLEEGRQDKSRNRIDVTAVEITWSPMTRWLKNQLLGYDGAPLFPFDSGQWGSGIKTCRDVNEIVSLPSLEEQRKTEPVAPVRTLANGYLKWSVLDRDLADALIYVGKYGDGMRAGMEAALCRAFSATPHSSDSVDCSKADTLPLNGHIIFVTHSLGSRLTYDTLSPLGDALHGRWLGAPLAEYIKAHLVGVYMMANQLPMLGLANVDPKWDPLEVNSQHPFELDRESEVKPTESAAKATPFEKNILAHDSLARLLSDREQYYTKKQEVAPTLNLVSFNDTNDLLTWHLPPWYAAGSLRPRVNVTDIFVENGVRWFGMLENPATAHSGYFSNRNVARVMMCGVTAGKVNDC